MCHEFGVLVKPDYDFSQESEGRVVGERLPVGNASSRSPQMRNVGTAC